MLLEDWKWQAYQIWFWVLLIISLESIQDFSLCKGRMLISYLLNRLNSIWNKNKITQNFHLEHVVRILALTPPSLGQTDLLAWIKSSNVCFSIKSMANSLIHPVILHHDKKVWTKLWKLRLPYWLLFLGWRVAKNILPIRNNLGRRKISDFTTCPLCSRIGETITHIFKGWQVAKSLWLQIVSLRAKQNNWDAHFDIIRFIISMMKNDGCNGQLFALKMMILFDFIWSYRSKLISPNIHEAIRYLIPSIHKTY